MSFKIESLLDFMIKNRGSDMIISAGHPPSIRLQGKMRPIAKQVLSVDDSMALVKSVLPERNVKEFEEVKSTDFGFGYGGARFRAGAYWQQEKPALVVRLIPQDIFTFEELGLPPNIKDEALRPRGLFLVTGPTGSGKTTTLSSIVNYINESSCKHILTIEDPVEFLHTPKKSVISHREVGIDVPSFAEGLRRALRQNPDVILIGEMRDLETIEIALTAAETGHLVMGTLHTTSSYATVNRIVDVFPSDQQDMVRIQLSVGLNLVLCQQLLEKVGGGRVPAYEIMRVNTGIRNLIRENKIQQIPSAIQVSGSDGNILLDDYLFNLYKAGQIKYDHMIEKCSSPKNLIQRVQEWMEEQEKAQKKKR